MIVQSNPIKFAKALLKKEYDIVTFASPKTNQVYFEADRETEKTPEFWDKILSGKAMCALFPAYNWHGSIDEYHQHDNLLIFLLNIIFKAQDRHVSTSVFL